LVSYTNFIQSQFKSSWLEWFCFGFLKLKSFRILVIESFYFWVLQIRVLCGVDHDDLKQLFHVSKVIREAVSVLNLDFFSWFD
jgi:hypothetical protein